MPFAPCMPPIDADPCDVQDWLSYSFTLVFYLVQESPSCKKQYQQTGVKAGNCMSAVWCRATCVHWHARRCVKSCSALLCGPKHTLQRSLGDIISELQLTYNEVVSCDIDLSLTTCILLCMACKPGLMVAAAPAATPCPKCMPGFTWLVPICPAPVHMHKRVNRFSAASG